MKRSLYILLFIFGIISQISFAQTWQWSKQIGSYSGDAVKKIVADKNNNIYIAGSYTGFYCYFENDTVGCNGYNDFFIAKYSPSGQELWVKSFGGYNNSSGYEFSSLAYDSINNYLILAGSFIGTCSFDTIALNTAGSEDGFIAKYDLSGNCQWAKRSGGHGIDIIADVGVDRNGDICIVGNNTDSATFGSSSIASGVFLAKYDSSGNCLWAKKKFNPANNPQGYEIVPYSLQTYQNDIFIGGLCEVDTLAVDSVLLINARKTSMLIARFDSMGTAKWVITGGGPWVGDGYSIAVDHSGNSYMTGSFGNTVFFGDDTIYNSGNDFFLAKYNPSGQFSWVRQCHDSIGALGYGVGLDRDSGVYVTGQFSGKAYFGDYIINAGTLVDMFIAKYSSSGECLGATNTGYASGRSICTDKNNEVVSAGVFLGTIAFGSNPSMTTYGSSDIYIAKSDAITGIGEARMANNELLIYANPTSGTCNVTIPDEFLNEKNLTLSVYDNTGKLIQQGRIELNEDKVRVNLEAEAKGIYNVTLSNGKKSYGGKIIFE